MGDRVASQAPAGPDECDLVMKGGITSGVVYPSAVLRLKERYRFRNIGGASAGAIAAVVTAAAEYGEQSGAGSGAAYDAFRDTLNDLAKPGFMLALFQPAPKTRPIFDILIASLREPGPAPRRTGADEANRPDDPVARKRARTRYKAVSIAKAILGPQRWVAGLGLAGGLVVWLVLLALGIWSGMIDRVGAWSAGAFVIAGFTLLVTVVLGGGAAVLIGLVRAGRAAYARVGSNGFGLCPGMRQEGFEGPGLSDWMHEMIQRCAGLDESRPLTFGDLEGKGIHLETVSTNLSYSRPFRIPFEEAGRFLFKREELSEIFPAPVLDWMVSHPPSNCGDPPEGLSWVPEASQLPVLLGARMSLSFPLLFSAVPLHAVDEANPKRPVVANWFSDGGISSNFPIHFFDGWLPSRPTFGLNLGAYPTDRRGRRVPNLRGTVESAADDWATGDVFMPSTRADGQFPRWFHFSGVGGFVARIADTMENWRDNMQAELPGFRDRICEIRLDDDEGGMHLTMPADRIRDLMEKGQAAGDRLADHFDWAQHRWTRYLMLMETLQVRLEGDEAHPASQATHARFDALYAPMLALGPPDVPDFREDHDHEWCLLAKDATERFLAGSRAWDDIPIRFRLTEGAPPWVMRLAPKV